MTSMKRIAILVALAPTKMRLVMLAAAILTIALCAAGTVRANPWPQTAISDYFNNCVRIHKERWQGVAEAVVTRLCTCKVSKLQVYNSWERFAKAYKEINPHFMEMFVALSMEEQLSLMKELDAAVQLTMLSVVRAEEECAPK
jgi:hypothetical protein